MTHARKLRQTALSIDARLRSFLLTLAAIALLAMMLLMVYNIVARTWFDAPVDGVVAIVGDAMMVAVVYLALCTPVHISLRIAVRFLPDSLERLVDTLTWLVSLAVLSVAAWASWGRAVSSYERAERTVGTFTFQLYPYRFLVAAGILATAVHVVIVGRRWVAGMSEADHVGGDRPVMDSGAGIEEPTK